MKKMFVCVLALALFLAVGCSGGVDFEKVVETANASLCSEVASDGSYLIVDTNPYNIEDFYDADFLEALKTINTELGFSDALYEKMLQTRALDGRQTDENDKISVSWTYHPDNGLQVMYEKK